MAPLDVDALIFGGANDVFVFGVEELGRYQEPTIVISSTADHYLPFSNDEAYGDVLAFFREEQIEMFELSPSCHINRQ